MSKKLKTTQIKWQMATFVGDNSDKEIIEVDASGVKIRLGILKTGQKVNCPVAAIDGVNFMTDAQLVEAVAAKKKKRGRKKKASTVVEA